MFCSMDGFVWARFWSPNESLQGDQPNKEFTEPQLAKLISLQNFSACNWLEP